MSKKIGLKFASNIDVLVHLGSLYKNAADALKENVSNAIDEHLKSEAMKDNRRLVQNCEVVFTLEKDSITIEYPYGMNRAEFESALQNIVKSNKGNFIGAALIGSHGIGMFNFFAVGDHCVMYTKKYKEEETVRVLIKKTEDKADISTARKHESLKDPGIKIVISQLHTDPTKDRGPLSIKAFSKFLSEKFDAYLRLSWLKVSIKVGSEVHNVETQKIELPRLAKGFSELYVKGDKKRKINLELYYDPSGKGFVSVRHRKVVVLRNLCEIEGYSIEESVFCKGNIRGYIDAEFLQTSPTRTSFEQNEDYLEFIIELDQICPMIEAEIQLHKQEEEKNRLSEIQRTAVNMAKEIFDGEEFADLEIPDGLGERAPIPILPPNGFDFVPSSLRVAPGETARIPLRVFVPKKVKSGSIVHFSSESDAIEISHRSIVLEKKNANKHGVVSFRLLEITGKRVTSAPVIITAKTGEFVARARIRVAEHVERGPIIGTVEKNNHINFLETDKFEGPERHSRYAANTIQINKLNPDYKKASNGSDRDKIMYASMLIAKEVLVHNDPSCDDSLERFVTVLYKMQEKVENLKKKAK